jgi:hypothetical protein
MSGATTTVGGNRGVRCGGIAIRRIWMNGGRAATLFPYARFGMRGRFVVE